MERLSVNRLRRDNEIESDVKSDDGGESDEEQYAGSDEESSDDLHPNSCKASAPTTLQPFVSPRPSLYPRVAIAS